MSASPYITLLSIIFTCSGVSATLLYLYLDPEKNLPVAYTTMGIALGLMVASFVGLGLYLFKRVYYRGIVSSAILHASVRQGFLIAGGCIGLVVFHQLGILTMRTGSLLFFIIFLFELMIQSIVEES